MYLGVLGIGCEMAVFSRSGDSITNQENGDYYRNLCSEALVLAGENAPGAAQL
jgi:hypothetical protein